MNNKKDWIRMLGVPDSCVVAKTSASERGRSFNLLLTKGSSALRVWVDSCWLQSNDRRKTDYMFVAETRPDDRLCLLVEFKGGHYGEALKQIAETIVYLKKLPSYRRKPPKTLVAYAVLSNGNQIPGYQNREEELREQHGVRIYRCCRHGEYRVKALVK